MSASLEEMFSRKFRQVKQMAAEKLGSVEQLTAFPAEYVELEKRLQLTEESLQILKNNAKNFISSGAFSEKPYLEPAIGFVNKLNNTFSNLSVGTLGNGTPSSSSSSHDAKSPTNAQSQRENIHEATFKSLKGACDRLEFGSPASVAINKHAVMQQEMALYRREMDERIKNVYLASLKMMLETNIKNAKSACEEARNAQFELNSIKSKCKKAKSEDLAVLQDNLQVTQEAYMNSVDEAIILMKLAVDSNDWVTCLEEFGSAQKEFHRKCYQLLNE